MDEPEFCSHGNLHVSCFTPCRRCGHGCNRHRRHDGPCNKVSFGAYGVTTGCECQSFAHGPLGLEAMAEALEDADA